MFLLQPWYKFLGGRPEMFALPRLISLTVALVTDPQIASVNAQYRGENPAYV